MPTSATAPFTLSFEQSGQGELPITLAHVQSLALDLGYVKAGVDPTKPLGARVDMKAFFDAYAVKAFSTWKHKFCTEPLLPIGPGGVPMTKPKKEEAQVEAVEVEVDPKDIPDVSKYEQLSSTYEDLKWRIISRPGGATMKPLNFYRMKACVSQVTQGDCNTEKPMWAAHGGLDFNGREAWDQWDKLKGKSAEDAKKLFCRVWAEVHADSKTNLRVW